MVQDWAFSFHWFKLIYSKLCNRCVQKSSYCLGQYASQAEPLSGPYKFKAGHATKEQIIHDSDVGTWRVFLKDESIDP